MFQSTNQWLLAKPPLRLSRLMLIYCHVPLTMFETTNQIHHFSPHFWSPQKKIHGKSQIHHDPPAWRSAAADVDLRYGQRPRSWDFTMENLGEIEGNMMKHRLFSFRMGWSMIKRLFSSMKFWTLKNCFFFIHEEWRRWRILSNIRLFSFRMEWSMIRHENIWGPTIIHEFQGTPYYDPNQWTILGLKPMSTPSLPRFKDQSAWMLTQA